MKISSWSQERRRRAPVTIFRSQGQPATIAAGSVPKGRRRSPPPFASDTDGPPSGRWLTADSFGLHFSPHPHGVLTGIVTQPAHEAHESDFPLPMPPLKTS